MPNWTNSCITITAPKETIDKFIADAKPLSEDELIEGNPFSFESWIPRPETFTDFDTTNHPDGKNIQVGFDVDVCGIRTKVTTENLDEIVSKYKEATKHQKETYGVVGWYDWNCKYWGTKWNCGFDITPCSDTQIAINTQTAWAEPTPFFAEIARRYPDMEISILAHDEYPWNKGVKIKGESVEVFSPDKSKVLNYFHEQINENKDWTEKEKEDYHQYANDFINEEIWDCSGSIYDDYDEFTSWYIDMRTRDKNDN